MITPGFFGLYNAHRGLLAAQSALNVVNHNMANANTPGYSRQQVRLEAFNPYNTTALVRGTNEAQMGQGVDVSEITRLRDSFLQNQVYSQTSEYQENDVHRNVLSQVEDILAEPSENGINTAVQNFFDAAHELSLHPDNRAARSDFLQQGANMINAFQQQASMLQSLRTHLVGDPTVSSTLSSSEAYLTVTDVNTKLASLANLNQQINTVTASGAQPNDLLDQRDQLIEELSELVDVTVTQGNENQINLAIGGTTFIRGVSQVESLTIATNTTAAPGPDNNPALITLTTAGTAMNSAFTGGKLRGILDMGGNATGTTSVRSVLGRLNSAVSAIATEVNTLQAAGRDLSGNLGSNPVFSLSAGSTLAIFRYSVNSTVLADNTLLAAAKDDSTDPSGFVGVGDGRNALDMAQIRDAVVASLGSTKVSDYLNTTVSTIGTDGRAYSDRAASLKNAIQALDARRQEVSGVNVDEEMIDMLRFQKAFEASSRLIRVFDEMAQAVLQMV